MSLEERMEKMGRRWWKEAVGYQIYPRSFFDSNGDGIGDLPGIRQKLDYLESLGVDLVWLNPVYPSPNDDNGYDISHYQDIMAEFGTLADWEGLLEDLHRRGIRLIMDLVINHTSDEHPWFAESRENPRGGKRDYYIWRPGSLEGTEPPNNWGSIFGGSAWEYDAASGEYYLHLFSRKQPDLNWRNPDMRRDIYAMIEWWLDKGIDGFRLDAVNLIGKAEGLPDGPLPEGGKAYGSAYGSALPYTHNQPELHDYLREMNRAVFSRYDIFTVGECSHTSPEEAARLVRREREELDTLFFFDHMFLDLDDQGNRFADRPWTVPAMKRIFETYYQVLFDRGWGTVYWANHDFPRAVNRLGSVESEESRRRSSMMLLTLQMTLPGTPFLYQGDELGMVNAGFESMEDYRDVETWNHCREARGRGMPEEELLELYRRKSRDNSRTPFPWTDGPSVGFTEGTPWIRPARGSGRISAERQEGDADSVLNYTRRLIAWRREQLGLVYSDFELLAPEDEALFAFRRRAAGKAAGKAAGDGQGAWLVLANWSGNESEIPGAVGLDGWSRAFGNYPPGGMEGLSLRPWEAVILVRASG